MTIDFVILSERPVTLRTLNGKVFPDPPLAVG